MCRKEIITKSRYGIFSNRKFLYPISKHPCSTNPTPYPEDESSKLFRNISITYQFAWKSYRTRHESEFLNVLFVVHLRDVAVTWSINSREKMDLRTVPA
jgi:hypothetical protein